MTLTEHRSLTNLLNKGIEPFEAYSGSIPETVPAIRLDGRVWASGNIVLQQILDALNLGDKERISAWGENYFDLSDLLAAFEDRIKLQPDSGFLTGIRGVVDLSHVS